MGYYAAIKMMFSKKFNAVKKKQDMKLYSLSAPGYITIMINYKH